MWLYNFVHMQMPPWTYSQLDSFETCPRKFYHLKVARDIVEPPSPHAEWGTRVHTAFEEWIKNGSPLPEGMTQWQSLAEKLAKLPGEKLCEQKMALDKNFQPTDWKTSWTRGVADLLVVHKDRAVVADYKTGKRKLDGDQMRLFALMGFAQFPELQTIGTGYIWLATGDFDTQIYHRYEVAQLWETFLPRVARLKHAHATASWPPRPSGLCRGWCAVKSCEFYQEKNR